MTAAVCVRFDVLALASILGRICDWLPSEEHEAPGLNCVEYGSSKQKDLTNCHKLFFVSLLSTYSYAFPFGVCPPPTNTTHNVEEDDDDWFSVAVLHSKLLLTAVGLDFLELKHCVEDFLWFRGGVWVVEVLQLLQFPVDLVLCLALLCGGCLCLN